MPKLSTFESLPSPALRVKKTYQKKIYTRRELEEENFTSKNDILTVGKQTTGKSKSKEMHLGPNEQLRPTGWQRPRRPI